MKPRLTTIVIVVLVIGLLVIGYLAFVGVAKDKDIVGPAIDPTGAERTQLAYAYYSLRLNIHNNIGGGYKCTIEDFTSEVYRYVNGSPPLTTYQDKLDILGLFGHDDIDVKFEVQVSGPNNWIGDPWTGKDMVEVGEGDHKVLTWDDGFSYFWDKGTYTYSIQVWLKGQDTGHEWVLKASDTGTFDVNFVRL